MSSQQQDQAKAASGQDIERLRRELLRRRIGAAGKREENNPRIPCRPEGQTVVPLSYPQQRLWFLEQLGGTGNAYHVPVVVRLSGALDVAALSGALSEVIRRHEALRTRFEERDGAGVQVIDAPWAVSLSAEAVSAAELRERIGGLACAPFDLQRDRLLRVALLQSGPDEHVLVLVMHHIVTDGWSMGILLREVAQLYAAHASGQAPTLPPLSLQYADWAVWQRQWLEGETLARQLTWWRQALADAPAALELPTDHRRPAVPSYRGGVHRLRLTSEQAAGLTALARRENATLFMVLLAAFKRVLSYWSGQDDIVVGTPTANRTRAETEGLIGFFVNTLVLRTSLEGDPGFRALLARVRDSALGAYAHQDLPFEKLVEVLQPVRDTSRQPLFQVMFVLQAAAEAPPSLGGLQLQAMDDDDAQAVTAKFDLTLSVTTQAAGVAVEFEYARDLFEAATIERLSRQWLRLLDAAVADPDRPLSQIDLLDAQERQQVLHAWQGEAMADCGESLDRLLSAQARRTPEAVAVIGDDSALSYGELEARANRLAQHLRSLGVGTDVIVGLCLERSIDLMVAIRATLKAGAAFLPLDPAYPAERRVYMLNDAGARVVITVEALAGVLPVGPTLVCLDRDAGLIAAHADEAPAHACAPDHLAYIIYTSGSTGRPKGAAVCHRGALNLYRWYQRRYALDPGRRVLVLSSHSFDLTLKNLLAPLLGGATVVLAPPGLLDGDAILALLRQHDIGLVNCAPSQFYPVLELMQDGRARLPESLEWLILGGEPIRRELLPRNGRCRVINSYGPTEASDVVADGLVDEQGEGAVTILGRPIAGTRLYVLDRHQQPVPVGVAGELYVAGAGLSRGYLGRAGQSAERFLPDPFAAGGRLYRTGDRVRWLADGRLDFLGRVDHQVKIRGFRIELGEIETVLRGFKSVREAVVIAREDTPGLQRLVAYLVQEGTPLTAQRLRLRLQSRLPDYMVPSAFVMLDQLPLTPSGKLDRKALPMPQRGLDDQSYVAPATSAERLLAGMFAEVLGIDRVGIHDNFFDLGGNSLLAIRLMTHITAALGRKVPLLVLFSNPTVAALAALLDEEAAGAAKSSYRLQLRGRPDARSTVLFMPTVLGLGSMYSKLAAQMTIAADMLTCRLPGSEPGEEVLTTIEAIAAHCLEHVVEPLDREDWSLVGWSFGGALAYELARQMRERGLKVRQLVLVDSYLTASEAAEEDATDSAVDMEMELQRTLHGELFSQLDQMQLQPTARAHELALRRYRPGSYDGAMAEIRCETNVRRLALGRISRLRPVHDRPDVQPQVVPGDHYSMLAEERLPELARVLDGLLLEQARSTDVD